MNTLKKNLIVYDEGRFGGYDFGFFLGRFGVCCWYCFLLVIHVNRLIKEEKRRGQENMSVWERRIV